MAGEVKCLGDAVALWVARAFLSPRKVLRLEQREPATGLSTRPLVSVLLDSSQVSLWVDKRASFSANNEVCSQAKWEGGENQCTASESKVS